MNSAMIVWLYLALLFAVFAGLLGFSWWLDKRDRDQYPRDWDDD